MTSSLAVIGRDWSVAPTEWRSSLENPSVSLAFPSEWLLDTFNGGRTDSGSRVNELTAFQVSTFLACVDLISGKISSLPWSIQERTYLNGRAVNRDAYEHDYYDLIHVEPNPEMTSQTLLRTFLCHCLAWTNGYCEIQRDGGNNAVALWPRSPMKTRPRRLLTALRLDPQPWRPFPVSLPSGTMVYGTTDGLDDHDNSEPGANSGPERIIPMDDMLHVPGLSFDGRLGHSVISLARQTIGLALATEKFGAKYFANFARPGGILTSPANQSPEQRELARISWQQLNGGENGNRTAVMPFGWEFKGMSNNPQEAQVTETRGYIRNDIAAMMHVPSRMVGDSAKSSKASTEQENQELLDYTFAPWINSIKLEWKRKLFPHRGIGRTPRNNFYVNCDVTQMIRGDAASREKFNASGRQWGYLNANDVRALEGLNPIEDSAAEKYWIPVNMTLTDTPINPTHQDGAGNGVVPKPGKGEPNASEGE